MNVQTFVNDFSKALHENNAAVFYALINLKQLT